MHSDLYQLIELGLGVLMLLGLGVGAKLLFWDLPARWFGRSERRITQLEERYVRMLEAVLEQRDRLDEYEDRLEFDEDSGNGSLNGRDTPTPATPV